MYKNSGQVCSSVGVGLRWVKDESHAGVGRPSWEQSIGLEQGVHGHTVTG